MMSQAAPANPGSFWEGQLASIFTELKDINTKLALLQRADDVSIAERKNLEYRVTQAEQAIHVLENAPTQRQQQSIQGWSLGLNGCSTIAFVVSAAAGCIGTLVGVAAIVVALVK